MANIKFLSTVAEIIGDHSNFLKLKVVIFYTKFRDNYYAHNPYMYACIDVVFKPRTKDNYFQF